MVDRGSGTRFAVFLTGHASPYSQKKYGGYAQMCVDLLRDPGETWDIIPVLEGVLPSQQQLDGYDGFVLTGSRHNAHGNEEWILQLCDVLRALHGKRKKVLGICFGHQILARALGGTTGRASVGWELGIREVAVTEALVSKPYALNLHPVLKIIESHQDQVSEIPHGGELLGSSERTQIEMFAVGNHILAIQGHPEFKEDVILDLIDSRLALGMISEEMANNAKLSVQETKPDGETLQKLCKKFLKN